jgi:NAD-dependent SIR2 family protein deacetylase
MDSFVDGNQMAGGLRDVFAVDMTVARGRCASCGRVAMIAEAHVFDETGPGLVARCPGCEAVLMRMVRAPERVWLDMGGLTYLEVPMG